MEMLHGSHGWEKLVSDLQQKEEADAQQAAGQDEQQPPPGRRKRGRPPKDSCDPLTQGVRSALTSDLYTLCFACLLPIFICCRHP